MDTAEKGHLKLLHRTANLLPLKAQMFLIKGVVDFVSVLSDLTDSSTKNLSHLSFASGEQRKTVCCLFLSSMDNRQCISHYVPHTGLFKL